MQEESKIRLMTRKLHPAVNETLMGLHEALIIFLLPQTISSNNIPKNYPQTISPDVNTIGAISKRKKMVEVSESFMAPV